jgi:hypothetical protein
MKTSRKGASQTDTLLPPRFVVNRVNWHASKRGFLRLAGAFPHSSFATREQADAERWRLENAARAIVDPFATAPAPHEQTSLPAFALRDWLLDAGAHSPPADATGTGWSAWWKAESPKWSPELRAKVWDRLDKVHFYEVEERPAGQVVYLVVDADAHYFGRWFNGLEGAFRTRSSAQASCNRRNKKAEVEEFEPVEAPEGDPFTNPKACCDFECKPRLESDLMGLPHYEVFELEVDGSPRGRVQIVVRNIWMHDFRRYGRNEMEAGPCWAFVRGFGSKAAAEKFRRQQETITRAVLRPGQVDCSLPDDFTDRVEKIGLVPPDALKDDDDGIGNSLLDWWDSLGGSPTAEQRAKVWDLLGGVGFFEILETELKD